MKQGPVDGKGPRKLTDNSFGDNPDAFRVREASPHTRLLSLGQRASDPARAAESHEEGALWNAVGYSHIMSSPTAPPAAPAPPGVTWDESAWPVIQLAFTDATGDEHFLWSLSQFERVFARRQRYLFILDATKATHIPSASARQAIGKWQDAHYENTRTWGAGGVMLISSALVRGALTAISWVHKTPAQLYYPATRDQGVEWCIRTAEQAGIAVSEAAQRRLRLGA